MLFNNVGINRPGILSRLNSAIFPNPGRCKYLTKLEFLAEILLQFVIILAIALNKFWSKYGFMHAVCFIAGYA